MPEMDGVEATAAIRSTEGDYFKKLPVVALTANALSGMGEMFLSNGFSDYLTKPIEVLKLNEILERWIPAEKRERTSLTAAREAIPESIGIEVKGLDTVRGIALTGGSERAYREVLTLFCRDVQERLGILRNVPNAADLPLFVINVHALKSASASIGAAALSEWAKYLEEAGNAGDIPAIRERLAGFREALSDLAENILAALRPERAAESSEEASPLDRGVLLKLKESLETENIGTTDAILDELLEKPFDAETKKLMDKISVGVLSYEFAEAIAAVEALIDRETGTR
jgi:CheY-like chemotaxis protein